MSETTGSVEERIINATIDCIEQYGLPGATNRQIAQAAGVNLAAINYYFRSKEALIQRVMEITLKNAFDLSGVPPMPDASARERCAAILLELVQGGQRYPGITRAHFSSLLVGGRPDPLFAAHLNRFIADLAADLQARGTNLALPELKLALVQLVSAAFLAILGPDLFARVVDLRDERVCKEYIERLVDRLLV